MDKSQLFELYEMLGLILPGAVFIYGISFLYPELSSFSFSNDLSAGALGIFIILSYVMGHIVQVAGEYVELFWRQIRGEPSEWVIEGNKQLFTTPQIKALEKKIPQAVAMDGDFSMSSLTRKQWLAMHKQLIIIVTNAERGKRLQKFNAIYVMCRGLVAAIVLLLIFSLFGHQTIGITTPFILAGLASILFYRMTKYERHAVQELFLQFLQTPLKE